MQAPKKHSEPESSGDCPSEYLTQDKSPGLYLQVWAAQEGHDLGQGNFVAKANPEGAES